MNGSTIGSNPAQGYLGSLWKKGLEIGYHHTNPGLQRARVMLLNGLVIIVCFSVIPFSIVFAIIGYKHFYGPLYIIPIGLLVLRLNFKGLFREAQNTYFFGALLVVTYWCFEGRGNGNEFILVGVATTSALVFEKRKSVVLSNLACSIIFVAYKLYHDLTPFVPDPSLNYNIVSTAIMLNTIAVISFQIAYFRDLAKQYDKELKIKYDELHSAQMVLKSNNEEIGEMNTKLQRLTNQLEAMVRDKTLELQTYIDAIDINLYSCINDVDGKFLKVNDQLVESSGYSRMELVGSHYTLLATPEHQNESFTQRRTDLFSGKAWRGEVEHKSKQGLSYWFDCVVIPIKDSNGAIRCFLSIGLPITERKLNERLREETHGVLESIAFKASHKIRGPMARIKGLANLVTMNTLSNEELPVIAKNFAVCTDELSIAVSELVNFVNDHQELIKNATDSDPIRSTGYST